MKVSPAGTTYYIGEHFEVENGGGIKYILAGGQRIAKVAAANKYYYHKDHLGSSTIITDQTGSIVESTEYMPFGEQRTHTGATISDYKYTGQEFDPETGLYNYNARLYDPIIGRFITADTIVPRFSDPQALNRYAYCLNNPIIYIDPSGHFNLLKEISRPFKQVGNEIEHTLDKYGSTIATFTVSAASYYFAGALGGDVFYHMIAGAFSEGVNNAILGGDIEMGVLIGCISGGLTEFAAPFFPSNGFAERLASRSLVGATTGGISAELYGGNFWDGLKQGGKTAAYGFVFNHLMHEVGSRLPAYHRHGRNPPSWGSDNSKGLVTRELPGSGGTMAFDRVIKDYISYWGEALSVSFGLSATFNGGPKFGSQVYDWSSRMFNLATGNNADIPGYIPIGAINPGNAW